MALVKINNNILEVNRVVTYGCSYTYGSELADADFIEDAEKLKRKMGLPDFNRKYRSIIDSVELVTEQQKRAWPATLANHLNAEYLNRASGGTSVEDSLNRFRLDIINKNIKKSDLVILGVTTMNRWLHIDNNGTLLHFVQSVIDRNNPWHVAMVKVYDDVTLYKNHLTQLEQFSQEALAHNINFLGFPMVPDFKIYFKNKLSDDPNVSMDAEYLDILKWRSKRIFRDPCYDWELSLAKFATHKDVLGGNHWNTKVHQLFGSAIYNKIKL